MPELSVLERHRRSIVGFDAVLDFGSSDVELWNRLSPCEGWTAADVLRHVIGVHTVLADGLGETCPEPGDDLVTQWQGVRDAALRACAAPGALDTEIHLPRMGGIDMVAGRFLSSLATDVLVHTWDIARAIGADERLDPELVEKAYEAALPADELIRVSGMFGPRIEIGDDADAQSQMLAFFGRDPR